ncbi:MAG: regulatory protein GemA [Proteobacteria bacterium]|nr:regulatory protein GemA [Pseudomonadota bacterium]
MSDLLKHQRQLLGIAKGWALQNLPGWTEDCHRDLLARHGATHLWEVPRDSRGAQLHDARFPVSAVKGRVSATTMNGSQIEAALSDYEARGWPRRKTFQRAGTVRAVPPHISHIVRLWGRLGQADKVQRATRPALLAFCARQTGHDVHNLDALTTKEGQAVTEALKSWLAR